MMTRRDYIKLAEALKWSRPNMGRVMARKPNSRARLEQWCNDVTSIADTLLADNGRFNRDRFYTACGGLE